MTVIKRELYLTQIKPYIRTNLIKVIMGIIRFGKFTLMTQVMDELKDEGIKAIK